MVAKTVFSSLLMAIAAVPFATGCGVAGEGADPEAVTSVEQAAEATYRTSTFDFCDWKLGKTPNSTCTKVDYGAPLPKENVLCEADTKGYATGIYAIIPAPKREGAPFKYEDGSLLYGPEIRCIKRPDLNGGVISYNKPRPRQVLAQIQGFYDHPKAGKARAVFEYYLTGSVQDVEYAIQRLDAQDRWVDVVVQTGSQRAHDTKTVEATLQPNTTFRLEIRTTRTAPEGFSIYAMKLEVPLCVPNVNRPGTCL